LYWGLPVFFARARTDTKIGPYALAIVLDPAGLSFGLHCLKHESTARFVSVALFLL
jgi:hypothetical protein